MAHVLGETIELCGLGFSTSRRSPVPLDTINGHYKNELGLKGDVYIAADRYDASGKLGRAIYEAWLEKQPPGVKEKGFGEIVVPVSG